MSEDLHNIDDLFRNALNQHEDTPSSGVWEGLDKELDKRKVVSIKKKYHTLKWVASALFILAFVMGIYALQVKMRNRELAKEKLQKEKTASKKIQSSQHNKSIAQDSTAVTPDASEKTEENPIAEKGTGSSDNYDTLQKFKRSFNVKEESGIDPNKSHGEKKTITNIQKPASVIQTVALSKSSIKEPSVKPVDNERIVNNVEAEENITALKQVPLNVAETYKNGQLQISELPPAESLQNTSIQPLIIQPSNILPSNDVPGMKENVPGMNNGTITRTNKTKTTNRSLFSATAFFSRDFVSANIKNDQTPRFPEDDKNEIKDKEKNGFSYTAGVLIDYNLNKKWSLQSGLTLVSRITEIEPKTIFARPDNRGEVMYRFNCSAGYAFIPVKSGGPRPSPGDNVVALASKNILRYIGVPLLIKYNFNAGNFSFSPATGFTANFLTKGSIETQINTGGGNQQEVINSISGLKSSYFTGTVSLNFAYNLNKRLSISLTPLGRFGLTSINKDGPVKSYLNTTGIAAGVTVKF